MIKLRNLPRNAQNNICHFSANKCLLRMKEVQFFAIFRNSYVFQVGKHSARLVNELFHFRRPALVQFSFSREYGEVSHYLSNDYFLRIYKFYQQHDEILGHKIFVEFYMERECFLWKLSIISKFGTENMKLVPAMVPPTYKQDVIFVQKVFF